mmetsp:Transcript_6996/g.13883  ORF Transcript_6996/g.13883 Transcript_6996/m.13883 type:complete len:1437 (+) Transcript_6996:205-4515(+)
MAGKESDAPPMEYICPLSLAIMEDPVFTIDGQCYERSLIELWLETHDTSPLTGKKLLGDGDVVDKRLIPNYFMRGVIEKWQNSWSERLGVPTIDTSQIRLNTTKPTKLFKESTLAERSEAPIYAGAQERQKRAAQIGVGQDKSVYRGWWNGRDVAVLEIRRGTCETEARVLQSLGQHPHCCTFLGISEDLKLLINELAPLGSLVDVLEDVRGKLRDEALLSKDLHLECLQQICSGMLCITNANLIHRDLALRNIVVFCYDAKNKNIKVKVTDFGLSRAGQYYNADSSVMPIRWTAPEALQAKKFSQQSDVWSYGVLTWELLDYAERMPYWEIQSDEQVKLEVGNGNISLRKPLLGDAELWEVAEGCLQRERKQRPTFETLQVELRTLVIKAAERRGMEAVIMMQKFSPELVGPAMSRLAVSAEQMQTMMQRNDRDGEKGGGKKSGSKSPPVRRNSACSWEQFSSDAVDSGEPSAERRNSSIPELGHQDVSPSETFEAHTDVPVVAAAEPASAMPNTLDLMLSELAPENGLLSAAESPAAESPLMASAGVGAGAGAAGAHAHAQPNVSVSPALVRILEQHKMPGARLSLESFGVEAPEDLLDLDEAAVDALQERHGLKGIDATRLRQYIKNNTVVSGFETAKSKQDLPAVMALMRQGAADASVQEEGCGVLLVLYPELQAANSAGAERDSELKMDMLVALEQAGVAQVLIRASVMHRASSLIQEVTCRVLACLCHLEANQARIVDAGGIGAIVAGMVQHAKNATVQEWGCLALWGLALNAANKSKVGMEGGIECIVRALKEHPTSIVVQEQGLGALRQLAVSEDNQSRIAAAGGIPAVVSAMRTHISHTGIQNKACETLWNLAAVNSDNRVKVAEAGGVAAVVQAMQAHLAHAGVQGAGCGALRILASNGNNLHRVVDEGGPRAIIAAMARHGSNIDLTCGCLAALRNLGSSADNQAKLASEGVIGSVLRAMLNHEKEARVQGLCCEALSNLTRQQLTEEDKTRVGDHAIPLVLKAMVAFAEHAEVQQGGCGTLESLGRNHARNQEKIRAAGGIETVLDVMLTHLESAGVEEAACAAIRTLTAGNTENQAKVAEKDGIWKLLAAIKKHVLNAAVTERGCAALRNLCALPENQPKIAEEAGIETALLAMKTHPSSAVIQELGCSFMYNMAFADANRSKIVQQKGVEAMVSAMKACAGSPGVLEWGCAALRMLAQNSAEHQQRVAECDGAEAVLLRRHALATHAAAQEQALKLLAVLAQHVPTMHRITRGGGIGGILSAMMQHPNHPGVQEQGCAAITPLATTPENQEALAMQNAIKLILIAMKAFPMVPAVQLQGCAALFNMALLTNNKVRIAQEGGVIGILVALRQFPADPMVQEYGVGVLNVLLTWNNQGTLTVIPDTLRRMRENSAKVTVMHALSKHPGRPRIQEWGRSLLHSLQ